MLNILHTYINEYSKEEIENAEKLCRLKYKLKHIATEITSTISKAYFSNPDKYYKITVDELLREILRNID